MKKIKEMLRRIGTAGLAAMMLTAQMPVTALAEEPTAVEQDGAEASDEEQQENDGNGELTAEKPEVETDGDTAIAETGGFSLYTVEFTYDSKQYVLPGDSEVALSEVLDTVGLTGEVSAVDVSNERLFSAKKCKTAEGGNTPEMDKDGEPKKDENGTWFVFAHKAFSTEEWMKVTIGGVMYEIAVTDDQSDYNISSGSITINSSNVSAWNGRTITGSVSQVGNSFPQGSSDGATYYRSAICIDGVSVNLTIRDLSIVAIFDNNVGAYKVSPILLLNGATLNLTLEGSNILTACVGGAGICVPDGCGLNISGSGSLVAKGGDGGASVQLYTCLGGAAIGAEDKPVGSELSRTGSITINGGTINATGGAAFNNRGGSAGIGGSGYVDGVVTINDGNVTAEGGDCAAGIGGGIAAGGTITINGGTVKAIANTAGSAIGSGAGTDSSTIAINGGSVTANGNIGSPGTGSGGSTLTVNFSRAVIACEGNGRVNCRNAAIQTFTVTVYDAALTQGDHACTFWVNEKNTNSAAMPATLRVSEAGVGTATVKGLVSYGDTYSMQVTGHLQIGDRTYDTAAVQMSAATTSMSLYSGYRVTLTGTVFDAAIASGQTGTVNVEGVTLASQSVSTSASKAAVSAVFYFKEGEVDDGGLTKAVTVTVGGKTYAVGNVTFTKSATHQKKGNFTVREGGIDYVKLNGEVAFVSPYNLIEANTVTWTGDNGGFYAAPAGQSVTIDNVVTVSGNVNLVLTDGSTLTAAKGIDMGAGSSLTIWQQSEGTGKVVAVARTDKTYAPGIGSTSVNNSSITINGGTVEATGYACPGIGGDSGNLNIAINAGKVTAKGSSSGGGEGIGSKSGTITINGGTVVATASGTGYAGIWSESGSIKINGGHVTATGTENGAAIGGNPSGGTGSIAISGGTVVANAVSDACAAAIGGGNSGSFTSITISGGNVTANGGQYAAAIGGGFYSKAGSATINITGGTVRANGGSSGAGIGNGWNGQCAITTTLNYDSASSGMSVYASSYRFKNDDATNTVKLSKAFKDAESGTGFAATDSADLAAIADKTLVPSESYGVTVSDTIEHGTVTASPSRTAKDDTVTLTVKPAEGYHLVTGSLKATYAAGGETKELALTPDANDPTKYSFTMPAADVTVTATFTNHEHEFTYTADGATITATCVNSEGSCDLTDHKATLTVNAPTGSLTYDGTAKPATLTGEIPGVTTPEITYAKAGDASFTGTPKDAGTYTASIMAEGATARVQFTIAKAGFQPKLVIQDKAYDGKEISYTITDNPGGGGVTSFSWEKEISNGTWSNVSDTPKDAGTYHGTATVAETDNYNGATTNTAEFTIGKAAEQTLSDVSISQVYTLTGVSASVAGKMPNDAGSLTYAKGTESKTGNVTVSSWDVDSSGTVTATLSGGAAGDTVTLPVTIGSANYADSTVNVVVTLREKDDAGVSISDPPPIPLQYLDTLVLIGSVQKPGTNGTWTWTSTDPEVLGITPNGAEAAIKALKVGTGTITASYESDTTKGSATVDLTVDPIPVTITGLSVSDKKYDGNTTAIVTGTAAIDGKIGDDDVTVTEGTAVFEDKNVGTDKAVTFSGYSLSGAAAGNYTLSGQPASVTASITPKEVSLTWGGTSFTYDGSEHCPTATAGGLISGDTCTVTVTGGQTNAGEYTATASELSDSNYKLPTDKTKAFTIDKANIETSQITKPEAKSNLTYTGSAQELVGAGSVADNIGTMYYAVTTENTAPSDESLYSTSIPTVTNAGTYYVWYKVEGDGNHKDTDPRKLEIEIVLIPSLAGGRVTAPAGAKLIFARYVTLENSKDGIPVMTSVKETLIAEDCAKTDPAVLLGLSKTPARGCKLLLLDPETDSPLCEAWDPEAGG